MNNKKRLFKPLIAILCALTFVLGAFALAACNDTDKKSAIAFARSEITTYVGDTVVLEVTTTPADAEVTYTSSNTGVATVSRRGIVTAVATGTTTVTAKLESGATAMCEITVLTRTITISQKTATVDLTETTELQLTATSSDGSAITWESSDTSVAIVGRDTGKVTFGKAIAKEAEVEIFARSGAAYDSCVITVVDPSIPDDYYLLMKETNANVVADPGTWYYHADGAESTNYRFSEAPAYGNEKLTVEMDIFPALSDGKYFRFRYQPDYPDGTRYTFKFTAKVNMDCKLGYGTNSANGGVSNTVLTADTAKNIIFIGTVNTGEPFHININEVLAAEMPEKVSIEISNIVVKEYEQGDENDIVIDIPTTPLPEEYELVRGSTGDTQDNMGKWYYMIDPVNAGASDYTEAKYDHGVITLALAGNLSGQYHQVRVQPRIAMGTRVEATFTVSLSAAGKITFGRNGNSNVRTAAVFGTELTAEDEANGVELYNVGEEVTLKKIFVVTQNDPFVIAVVPDNTNLPCTMIVKAVDFTAKPLADYTVTFDTKGGDAIEAATVKEEAALATLPTPTRDGGYTFLGWFESEDYEGTALVAPYTPEGNVTLYAKWADPEEVIYTVSYNTNGGNAIDNQTVMGGGSVTLATPTRDGYVFDGWYEEADFSGDKLGATYTPTATIVLNAKWLAQYTVTLNKNTNSMFSGVDTGAKTVTEGGSVTLPSLTRKGFTFDGWYVAADFSGDAVTGEYTPTASVTLNAKWTAVTEYDLVDGTYGDVSNNRGAWYYRLEGAQAAATATSATYNNGTVSITATGIVETASGNNAVEFRFMPDGFAAGDKYNITFKARVSAAGGKIKMGPANTSFQSVDIAADTDMTYTTTETVTVESGTVMKPYLIRWFNVGGETEVTFTVWDVVVEPWTAPASYQITNATNGTVVANPGVWYCNYPGASTVPGRECDEANTKYDNGVITFAFTNIVNADGQNGYQLRYQPDYPVDTKVTITFKFKLSVAGRVLYGRDYKNSNDSHGGQPMAADEELELTWTGTVNGSNPFMIQIKGVEDGPVVLTVWDFTVTEVTE